jgi:predicted DCC family thiol-disulfide oxidoreductase YuxK
VLIYDGDCAFCSSSARWIEERLPLGYPVVPWQSLPDLDAVGLDQREVEEAAWWIDVDGTPRRGHEAIGRALVAIGGAWSLAGRLLLVPPFSWVAAPVYAWIARNRSRLPGGTPACDVPGD